mmetsp:Transcript_30742/g.76501  ORF Transcript_30742/g.76501 Transcript_30742/m.76501 type:complete len:83 (-) Transcript_30742:250-498(-)
MLLRGCAPAAKPNKPTTRWFFGGFSLSTLFLLIGVAYKVEHSEVVAHGIGFAAECRPAAGGDAVKPCRALRCGPAGGTSPFG